MECVGQTNLQSLRVERNSTRDKANEYAKGIYKQPNSRINNGPIQIDDFDDEDDDSDGQNGYQHNFTGLNNLTQLDHNNDFFADEIEKIKQMFN